jgi:penicillin amidase
MVFLARCAFCEREAGMARQAWRIWTRRIVLLLAALLALAVLGAWLFLRASLAQLDG